MKPASQQVEIIIPATIAALSNTSIIEKIALTEIVSNPECSTRKLSRITGLSGRGIEALLSRLRRRNLIRQEGKGRARRHLLTFPVEPHTKCEKIEHQKSHIHCDDNRHTPARVRPRESTADFVETRLAYYYNCCEFGAFRAARGHLEAIRQRVEQDTEIPAHLRSKCISGIIRQENRCFAMEVGRQMVRKLTDRQGEELIEKLISADAEKLSLFRQKVEAGALVTSSNDLLTLTHDTGLA
jgi:hypothetical protein